MALGLPRDSDANVSPVLDGSRSLLEDGKGGEAGGGRVKVKVKRKRGCERRRESRETKRDGGRRDGWQ